MAKGGTYLALFAGTLGFALAFAMPAFFRIPVPWYYPLEHRWALEVTAQGLAMDWYGRTLLASGVFALIFMGATLITRLVKPSERALSMWLVWTATAWTFAMGLYVYQLVQRTPTPEPLPSWYQPK